MKFEITIDGRPAMLTLHTNRFRYEPGNAPPIDREFSLVTLAPGSYSVLIDGRSYTAILGPTREVRVNGRTFNVEAFDPRSMRARRSAGAGHGPQNISALMPGKVIRLLVAQGDNVEAGQGLVVVEAMKMQNEMKSPKAGRVAEVRIKADATVAPGEVLMVIE